MRITEEVGDRFAGLDDWSEAAILETLWAGQAAAVAAVRPALPAIGRVANAVAERFRAGGRLIYAGAGTSGRLGRIDGLELPATYGFAPERIVFLTTGGLEFGGAIGAAEDDAGGAAAAVAALGPVSRDAVIAVAASGATPWTLAVARAARAGDAYVAAMVTAGGAPLAAAADAAILLETGPEVIAGSTRMAAGTAQKAALTVLSTLVGVRLGGVYDNLMVGMRPENAKLRERATGIVARITGAADAEARDALCRAGWDIRAGCLVVRGAEPARARALLAATEGNLRAALARLGA